MLLEGQKLEGELPGGLKRLLLNIEGLLHLHRRDGGSQSLNKTPPPKSRIKRKNFPVKNVAGKVEKAFYKERF